MSLNIVTGANRGIGLALVEQLVKRGHPVVGACRKSSAALTKLGVEVVEGVDVTLEAGAAALARAIGARPVSLLINNAGILIHGARLGELTFEDINRQFEVNALGPLRVTQALLTNLGNGSKVGLITSRMGSIDDNTSGGYYGYRMSKAALNMAGKSLAHDLKPAGVAVAILHPGMVKTDMVGGAGQVEPEQAARGLLARLDELTLATSGGFWHANGERLPW
jgi:NAD(P)-dependent dehydrogenase (short-subunit alcohol dehydrogenase family)